jgi:hypothetical protein
MIYDSVDDTINPVRTVLLHGENISCDASVFTTCTRASAIMIMNKVKQFRIFCTLFV